MAKKQNKKNSTPKPTATAPDTDSNIPDSVPETTDVGVELLPPVSHYGAKLQFMPGDDPLDWLERNAPIFLAEVAEMATNPDPKHAMSKVRFEALKTLISYPLPQANIYELRQTGSEIDRMTDEEVAQYLQDKVGALPPPPKTKKGRKRRRTKIEIMREKAQKKVPKK